CPRDNAPEGKLKSKASSPRRCVESQINPVECLRHLFFPEPIHLPSAMVIQIRCPGMGGGPFLAEVLRILEKSYSKTGGVDCPERGSFIDRRFHHRSVENIGLNLHEQIVVHHASINSEHLKTRATVFLHCLDDLARLKRSCLQNCSREMALVRISRQSGNHAPLIMLPVRSVQPRKCGHKI